MFRDECKIRVVDSLEEKLIREKSSKRCVTLYSVTSMGKYSYEAFTEDIRIRCVKSMNVLERL